MPHITKQDYKLNDQLQAEFHALCISRRLVFGNLDHMRAV